MKPTDRLCFGEFRLDPANALLVRGDERVVIAPKPFDLLCYLVERAGRLATKDELLDAVWGDGRGAESSLSVSINALRTALGDDSKSPTYIETVSRRGYRFVAPVLVEPEQSGPAAPERPQAEPAVLSAPLLRADGRNDLRVGRAAQLAALEALAAQAASGARQFVFLTGEAGIGKTTLVEMLIERLAARGVNVLAGRCVEHFSAEEAFLPLLEAIEDGAARAGSEAFRKALRDHAPTWVAEIPGVVPAEDLAALRHDVLGATRERRLREFADLFERLGAQGPWLLALEDLHWSDLATLDALSRLAHGRGRAPLLVVATYRKPDVALSDHPVGRLHQELHVRGLCAELPLSGLSQPNVERYLELRLGGETTSDLGAQVFWRTQGQPLFLVALVEYFVTQGMIVEVEGRWAPSALKPISQDGMPRDLAEAIARRIDRLAPNDQRMLEIASAAGAKFSAALVAAAMRREVGDVEEACEALARGGQALAPDGVEEWPDGAIAGRYRFQHALYQEFLQQRLAPGQRAQAHRLFGERLERAYAGRTQEVASTLAAYFEQGRDFARAARFLEEAAAQAAKRLNNREAAVYLDRALALVDRLPAESQAEARLRLLQNRGWTRRSAGDFMGAIEDFAATVALSETEGDREAQIRALVDLSRFCLFFDRARCLGLAGRAADLSRGLEIGDLRSLAEANRANLTLLLTGWRDDEAALCRSALAPLRGSNDAAMIVRNMQVEAVLELMNARYERCRAVAEDGEQRSHEAGDVYFYLVFSILKGTALVYLGRLGAALKLLREVLEQTEKNASRALSGPCLLHIAWIHAEAGDHEGALRICEEILDDGLKRNPSNYYLAYNVLAKARLGLGDLAGARAVLDEETRHVEDVIVETTHQYLYLHNGAELSLLSGDLAQARDWAQRLRRLAAAPPESAYLALAHRLSARIALAEGDLAQARADILDAAEVVAGGGAPLAAARVHDCAAEIFAAAGREEKAAEFRAEAARARGVLARSFDAGEPLQALMQRGVGHETIG
ncbi:ATP-binding protein [Methylocella sp.]|uniref:ATP-binding protein n=1 Tax=Methylocella sp. TaxID=1978226 RepID=UPI00378413AD